MVVLSPQRREGSSPSARSAVKLSESGRSIERGESEADRGPLRRIASSRRYKSRRQPEEPKLPYDDRPSNDDYFPQGEEFEVGDHPAASKRTSEKEPRRIDDDVSDNFAPTKLEGCGGCVGGNALTRLVMHAYLSPRATWTMTGHATRMSKGTFEKEATEKLQTLIEKVSEFKRRIFRSESNATNTGAQSGGKKKKEEEAGNGSNSANDSTGRSDFVGQKIFTSP